MFAVIARPARTFLVALGLIALAGCGGASTQPVSDPQPSATVNATNGLQFTPTPIRLTVGGTVTFKFGSVEHTVFFDNAPPGAPANIPNLTGNTSVSRTFTTAGTFVYNCHVHPGMSGTVIVQ
jgi:plastocyanin